MKINRNSWHYWLYDKVYVGFLRSNSHVEDPKTLCQYVRRIVIGSVGGAVGLVWAALVVIIMAAAVFIVVPGLLAHGLAILVNYSYGYDVFANYLTRDWVAVPIGYVLIGILFGILHAITCLFRKVSSSLKESEPGLVRSYVKDIKNKTCTLVEFE